MLKTERSELPIHTTTSQPALKDTKGLLITKATTVSHSQKSLGELERTIAALKTVIDKLQTENKKLKIRPNVFRTTTTCASNITAATKSSDKLKSSIGNLIEEKQLLMDQLHELEHDKSKYHQKYLESVAIIDNLQINLLDTEKKAKSAEMKLKSFLTTGQKIGGETIDEPGTSSATATGAIGLEPSSNERMFHYMREMQEKLERKEMLLNEAKEALKDAAAAAGIQEVDQEELQER